MFKCSDACGFARAADVMSTQSRTDFEWSLKLIGGRCFCAGIASELRREDSYIDDYDQNAILYCFSQIESGIRCGMETRDPRTGTDRSRTEWFGSVLGPDRTRTEKN